MKKILSILLGSILSLTLASSVMAIGKVTGSIDSVNLSLDANGNGVINMADQVTFTASSNAGNNFVFMKCYQNGVFEVSSGSLNYSGPTFTTQPTGLYSGATDVTQPEDCTVELQTLWGNGHNRQFKTLATASFTVLP
jgi:hypothetical protein